MRLLALVFAATALFALAGCGDGYGSMSRLEYRGDPPPITEAQKVAAEKKLVGDGAGFGSGPSSSGQGSKF